MPESSLSKSLHTIAFYNLENFFDTEDDPYALDDDFTPDGAKKWTKKRFEKKTKKMAKAIAQIGVEETKKPPVLIGVAEVENSRVLHALLRAEPLNDMDYAFVHFDSPDERGIDTALLYQKSCFEVYQAERVPLLINNADDGLRDYTRDILYVRGNLHGEEIHVFVNHWPSRRAGAERTSYKREKAAETVLAKIEALGIEGHNCIVMGDFNDDPNSASIQKLMGSGYFINPMQQLLSPQSGSANYKGEWNLFDQIIVAHSFLNHESGTHSFKKAAIFSDEMVSEWDGKFEGNPFRTFVGKKYLGGYSDHFPVYVTLKHNQ